MATTPPKPTSEIIADRALAASRNALGKGDDVSIETTSSERLPYTASKHLKVTPRSYHDRRSGRFSFEGARHQENFVEASRDAEQELVRWQDHTALKSLADPLVTDETLEHLLERDSGAGALLGPTVVAFAHCTCNGCAGHGYLECTPCNGTGKSPCNSMRCRFGYESCLGCGGSGRVRDASGQPISCGRCSSLGRHACTACGGLQRVLCLSCRGGGTFACSPCGGTGEFTDAYGIRIDYEHETSITLPKLTAIEENDFRAWVRHGFKSVTPDPVGPLPDGACLFEAVPDGRAGESFSFKTTIKGSFERVAVSGSVDGVALKADATRLDIVSICFDGFLDPQVRDLAVRCTEAGQSGDPHKAALHISSGPVIFRMLDDLRRGTSTFDATGKASAALDLAATPHALKDIAAAYGTVVSTHAARVMRRAWGAWGVIAIALTLLIMSTDLPWALRLILQPNIETFLLSTLALALIPTLISLVGAEFSARRAVTRISGQGTKLVDCRMRKLAPLTTWVICACLLAWPAINGPGNDAVRTSMYEIRTAIGYPSIGDMLRR